MKKENKTVSPSSFLATSFVFQTAGSLRHLILWAELHQALVSLSQ